MALLFLSEVKKLAIDKELFADLVNTNDQLSSFTDADIKGDIYDWVPTMIPSVDATMLGGFPLSGRITEIFGAASSGKSTTTEEAMKIALKMGVFVVLFDVENTTSQERLKGVGVNPDDVILFSPHRAKNGTIDDPITVEDVMNQLIELPAKLHAKDPTKRILFIWDTLAMTQPALTASKDIGDQQVGQQARALSEGFRKVVPNLVANGAGLVILNQARDDIGGNPFLNTVKTVGGKAVEHVDSMRLYMSHIKKITKSASDKVPIGEWSQFKFVKSKIGDNGGKLTPIAVMHDDENQLVGLDFEYNVFQEAVINKILPKGGWKSYTLQEGPNKGKEVKFQSDSGWIDYLKSEEGQEVLKELWQALIKKEFPKCYPALFNTNVPLTEKDFPIIEGLKDYYIKIQESLPVTAQHPNYHFWKELNSKGKKAKK